MWNEVWDAELGTGVQDLGWGLWAQLEFGDLAWENGDLGQGLEIEVRDCRLRMGIRSLVTKLWFAIPIEIVDGEEFKIMYEVWVRDCEWQLYIGARA